LEQNQKLNVERNVKSQNWKLEAHFAEKNCSIILALVSLVYVYTLVYTHTSTPPPLKKKSLFFFSQEFVMYSFGNLVLCALG